MLVLQTAAVACVDDPAPGPSERPAPSLVLEKRTRKYHYLKSIDLGRMTQARARECLKAYGKLVTKIVKEPAFWLPDDSLMSQEDLISIGQTLMLQACACYDPSHGNKESSWIGVFLRQGLGNVVRDARLISRTDARKRKETGVLPQRPTIVRIDERRGADTHEHAEFTFDLHGVLTSDSCTHEAAVTSMQRDRLYKMIDDGILDERERRFLLSSLDDLSPASIALQEGLSRHRVEQILERARCKLVKHYREEQKIKMRRLRRLEA